MVKKRNLGLVFFLVIGFAILYLQSISYAASCDEIVGVWKWDNGEITTFDRGGVIKTKNSFGELEKAGTWECIHASEGVITLNWNLRARNNLMKIITVSNVRRVALLNDGNRLTVEPKNTSNDIKNIKGAEKISKAATVKEPTLNPKNDETKNILESVEENAKNTRKSGLVCPKENCESTIPEQPSLKLESKPPLSPSEKSEIAKLRELGEQKKYIKVMPFEGVTLELPPSWKMVSGEQIDDVTSKKVFVPEFKIGAQIVIATKPPVFNSEEVQNMSDTVLQSIKPNILGDSLEDWGFNAIKSSAVKTEVRNNQVVINQMYLVADKEDILWNVEAIMRMTPKRNIGITFFYKLDSSPDLKEIISHAKDTFSVEE